jgi:molybdopterin molybdotransferase
MLSVAEALDLVLAQAARLPARRAALADALSLVLAEDVVSDIDSPPYDKSVVDGFALVAADLEGAGRELQILEEVTAGMVPSKCVERGTATRIMTGAPIPGGADAVVMVEQTEPRGQKVLTRQAGIKAGQNILPRAAALKAGERVLAAGKLLRPIELGLLAEVGCDRVKIVPRPSVAVLVTGNELVAGSARPGPGQIRNSNGPMLAALARSAGANSMELGIARDEQADLSRLIAAGLEHDILVISGGVSAGVLDLVPDVLTSLGVRQVFHKVNLKPGKPLWFGALERGHERRTPVFGLPGNPVSSLVCFELFVLPAIEKLRGLAPVGLRRRQAVLAVAHVQRGERPTYWPARLHGAEARVTPLAWKGSGDLCTLAEANCLIVFSAGERRYAAGDEVEVLLLD